MGKNKPARMPGFLKSEGFDINFGQHYANLSNEIARGYYRHYYYILSNYCVNMFKWNNLPNNIPEKFIEYVLMTIGYGAFSKEIMDSAIFTRCTLGGTYNIYWEPTQYNIYASNGFNKRITADRGEIIYNTYLRTPTIAYLDNYAARLAEAQAFIQVNLNACKTPVLIEMDDANQELTLKNAYAKYEGNTPVIFSLKKMGLSEAIKAIDLKPQFYVDKMQIYIRQVWNEAMTFIGIQNVDTEKRERLVTSEAEGNIQQVQMARKTMLDSRQDGARRANEKFGWDISVEFRLQEEEEGDLIGYNNDVSNAISGDFMPGFGKASADTE